MPEPATRCGRLQPGEPGLAVGQSRPDPALRLSTVPRLQAHGRAHAQPRDPRVVARSCPDFVASLACLETSSRIRAPIALYVATRTTSPISGSSNPANDVHKGRGADFIWNRSTFLPPLPGDAPTVSGSRTAFLGRHVRSPGVRGGEVWRRTRRVVVLVEARGELLAGGGDDGRGEEAGRDGGRRRGGGDGGLPRSTRRPGSTPPRATTGNRALEIHRVAAEHGILSAYPPVSAKLSP